MKKPQQNLKLVWATPIKNRFALVDLKPSNLFLALKNKKKYYLIALTKSAGLIKKSINKSLYLFLNNKTEAKI